MAISKEKRRRSNLNVRLKILVCFQLVVAGVSLTKAEVNTITEVATKDTVPISKSIDDSKLIKDNIDYDYQDSFPLAKQPRNLIVRTLYNKDLQEIQYNVSWVSDEDKNRESYEIRISLISNKEYCPDAEARFVYESINNKATSFIAPPDNYSFRLVPGCSYQIRLMAHPHNYIDFVAINNTIPDCLGLKCNCFKYKTNITEVFAWELGYKTYNVSWIISEDGPTNLTKIIVELVNETAYKDDILKESFPFELSPSDSENKHLTVLLNSTFDSYEHLEIYFKNNYNCESDVFDVSVLRLNRVNKDTLSNPRNFMFQANNLWYYVFIAMSTGIFVILSFFVYFRIHEKIMRRRFLNRSGHPDRNVYNSYHAVPGNNIKLNKYNIMYVEKEIIEGKTDKYEFPRNRIQLLKEIGKGAFGQVHLAKALSEDQGINYVAVKTLKESATNEETDDFYSEIEILKKIGDHPNIVSLVGCCTLRKPYIMMMEFVPCGDLKQYLVHLRDQWQKQWNEKENAATLIDGSYVHSEDSMQLYHKNSKLSHSSTPFVHLIANLTPTSKQHFSFELDLVLDNTELQDFAYQISTGMAHLEKIEITHRDLAARNILINFEKKLKISDFGLSRTGPYINNKLKKLPLRWMSIESIEDHFYDSKSDVWSFAILLWEIGTLGAFPYENIPDNMILFNLQRGKRLQRPEICTDDLYNLMLRCWAADPKERPSFADLTDLLDAKRQKVYVDFCQLNPSYMFPPTDLSSVKKKNLNQDQCDPDTVTSDEENTELVISDGEDEDETFETSS